MSTISNQVWAEVLVFAPSKEGKLVDALIQFHEDNEKDPNASLIFNAVPGATLLVLVYAEGVEERPSVFNAFDGIDAVAKMLPGSKYTIFHIMSALESSIATEPKKYAILPLNPNFPNVFAVSDIFAQQPRYANHVKFTRPRGIQSCK